MHSIPRIQLSERIHLFVFIYECGSRFVFAILSREIKYLHSTFNFSFVNVVVHLIGIYFGILIDQQW
jgi:hypothetical protein